MSSGVAADTGSVIIHEGYLFKTPPLDKFFMNWKKRWFVLSRHTPSDLTALDLAYYTDASKKSKVKSIDVRQIKAINPVHNNSKENVFSLELMNGKKFMLRSADKQGKALWVAKLLECCSKDGTSFHVTVPNQPCASYSECILKVATPLKVNAISSCTGEPVMTIPYDRLRRFGCQIAVDWDIIWFETCSCQSEMEEFLFFIVALGIEKAYQIVQEYKRSIELALRDHLIMEEGDQSQFLYSYVVKSHYGHPDYPSSGRDRILQSSLMSLSSSGGSLSLSELNKFARSRTTVPIMNVPIPGDMRKASLPIKSSASPSPVHSPTSTSPWQQSSKLTLEQLKCSPRPSMSSTGDEFDSGVNMEGLDPSRNSAPCYVPDLPASRGSSSPRAKLEAIRKGKSFDERSTPPTSPRGISLSDFKTKSSGRSVSEEQVRKASLADIAQSKGGLSLYSRGTQRTSPRTIREVDYTTGNSSELPTTPPYHYAGYDGHSHSREGYDYLEPVHPTH